MRSFLAAALLSLLPVAARAAGTDPAYVGRCVDVQATSLINANQMTTSRSFSLNRDNSEGFDELTLLNSLTDIDSSITRFDMVCTVSNDGNVTDYKPQICSEAGGTYTCVDTGTWQKAMSGTTKWRLIVKLRGMPDAECTYSVGTGSGASADVLTVNGRLCLAGSSN